MRGPTSQGVDAGFPPAWRNRQMPGTRHAGTYYDGCEAATLLVCSLHPFALDAARAGVHSRLPHHAQHIL